MYKRTIWQDHVEGIQEGTDMNAANFNNIEAGTMEANALAAMNSEYQRYAADVAKNNDPFSIFLAITPDTSTEHTFEFPPDKIRNHNGYKVTYEVLHMTGQIGSVVITSKSEHGVSIRLDGFNVVEDGYIVFYISGGMI